MGELFTPTHLMILVCVSFVWSAVFIVPFWFIFKKAGFSPFMSLLMILPGVNLAMLYVLAFSTWNSPGRSISNV